MIIQNYKNKPLRYFYVIVKIQNASNHIVNVFKMVNFAHKNVAVNLVKINNIVNNVMQHYKL